MFWTSSLTYHEIVFMYHLSWIIDRFVQAGVQFVFFLQSKKFHVKKVFLFLFSFFSLHVKNLQLYTFVISCSPESKISFPPKETQIFSSSTRPQQLNIWHMTISIAITMWFCKALNIISYLVYILLTSVKFYQNYISVFVHIGQISNFKYQISSTPQVQFSMQAE